MYYLSLIINVAGNPLYDIDRLGEGKKKQELVHTNTDWTHIAQESLTEGLITVQYELRMKRFSLT